MQPMFAVAGVLALVLGASAAAEERPQPSPAETPRLRSDGFAISSDACGASRYQHLVGEDYARTVQAALLPAQSNIAGHTQLTPLIYEPERLHVRLDAAGRILAIGCF